jgi:hypothetical protein
MLNAPPPQHYAAYRLTRIARCANLEHLQRRQFAYAIS